MTRKMYEIGPRSCSQCGKEFTPKHRGAQAARTKFCSLSCHMLWQHANTTRPHYVNPDIAPSSHPTTGEIAWASGVYEGEGAVVLVKNLDGGPKTQGVQVTQKDRWLCDRLQELFGGAVYSRGSHTQDHFVGKRNFKGEHRGFDWRLYGPRARGFLMTTYKFLSPRRQTQIRKALGIAVGA